MIRQNPLHYLLGLEGMALLRAYHGSHDAAFAEARLAAVRSLLSAPGFPDTTVGFASTVDGYRVWSETYDEPGNGLLAYEEPFVHRIVAGLPGGGVALDAACGTGRHSAFLASRGFSVVGVDSSAEMLARARAKVPSGLFALGDLEALPVADGSVDLVVCGLAMAHLPSLGAAFASAARVLRPGGRLIVTDIHHEAVLLGSVPHVRSRSGEPELIPSHRHRPSDYLTAALAAGLRLRECAEPMRPPGKFVPPSPEIGEWDTWPWTLLAVDPPAAEAAWDVPAAILWHFERP